MKNPQLLKEFLSDPEKRKIFDRNVNLIRLVDLSNDENQIEITANKFKPSYLQDYFAELGFISMISEKSWPKYTKTFEGLNNNA